MGTGLTSGALCFKGSLQTTKSESIKLRGPMKINSRIYKILLNAAITALPISPAWAIQANCFATDVDTLEDVDFEITDDTARGKHLVLESLNYQFTLGVYQSLQKGVIKVEVVSKNSGELSATKFDLDRENMGRMSFKRNGKYSASIYCFKKKRRIVV